MRCNFLDPYLNCLGAFATEGDAVAAGIVPSQYPLVLSFEDYCLVMYRIRAISVTVSLTESGPGSSGGWSGNGTFTLPMRQAKSHIMDSGSVLSANVIGPPPPNERYLCCPPFGTSGSWAEQDGLTVSSVQQLLLGSSCVFINGDARLALEFGASHPIEQQGISSVIDEYVIGSSSVTFSAFGRPIQLYQRERFGDAGYSYSGSISLGAVDYWPYAKKDGNEPWWDSATGEPIAPNPRA